MFTQYIEMNYAIIETNDQLEELVGYCSSVDDLVTSIQDTRAKHVINTVDEPDGDYIVKTSNGYDLINKSTHEAWSFFNGLSTIETVNKIKSWRLVPVRRTVANIPEVKLDIILDTVCSAYLVGKRSIGKT